MPEQAFLKGIQAYWDALGQPGQPPELGESQIDAFVDLLHVTSSAELGFTLLDLLEGSYGGIAVGDDSRPWRLHWAIQVGEVEPFVAPGLEGLIFLADTIADPEGRHRVYTIKDGTRGDLEFADLAGALRWMTAQVRHAKSEHDDGELQQIQSDASALLDDDWEKGPRPPSTSSKSSSTRRCTRHGTRSLVASGRSSSRTAANPLSTVRTVGNDACPFGSRAGSSRRALSNCRRR